LEEVCQTVHDKLKNKKPTTTTSSSSTTSMASSIASTSMATLIHLHLINYIYLTFYFILYLFNKNNKLIEE